MKLYVAARNRNVLISPGAFFRVHGEADEDARDPWMRVNVSRCEGPALAHRICERSSKKSESISSNAHKNSSSPIATSRSCAASTSAAKTCCP